MARVVDCCSLGGDLSGFTSRTVKLRRGRSASFDKCRNGEWSDGDGSSGRFGDDSPERGSE